MFNVTFRYSDGEVSVHEGVTSQTAHNLVSPVNLDRADQTGLVSVTVELAS